MLGKKILAIVMSFVLMLSAVQFQAFAMDKNIHDKDMILTCEEMNSIEQLECVGVDTELVEKLLTLSNHIHFNKDYKTLIVDLNDEALVKEYKFTEKQLKDFKAILAGTYQPTRMNRKTLDSIVATRSVARFYLSNADLKAGTFAVLATAAQISPAALMAAWTSITTALAGPLGTVVGFGTAALGAVFFADLALKITGAMIQGKGVAFYLDWGFPPVSTAIE